ncbi:MAG: sigma-70 family RNA polymerase sigma factor [Clostridiaceae bacterium]|nr:sigma-70 family RNA polymerase sigma factor [Clostridiaceae bacterium]
MQKLGTIYFGCLAQKTFAYPRSGSYSKRANYFTFSACKKVKRKEEEALNEKALIKASQKGDKLAFEKLIRLFYPYVSKFLLKMTCDEALSEDLTQETFLKMVRSIDRYDLNGSAAFGTWLITIAKNCYIDHLRKNRIILEDIEELQIDDPHDMMSGVIQKLQYEEVLRAMEMLPKEQGLAIRLKYEQDMTLAEIAEYLGIPTKTIKSRIHDGTAKLRRLLNLQERNEKNDP